MRYAALAALCALALAGCESAEGYCGKLYADGQPPEWAKGQFTDYEGCVNWYDANR